MRTTQITDAKHSALSEQSARSTKPAKSAMRLLPLSLSMLGLSSLGIVGCSSQDEANPSAAKSAIVKANTSATSRINCDDFVNFNGDVAGTRAEFISAPEATAWQWFVCLNQRPTMNSNGRNWEFFRPTSEVYLPGGYKPAPYNAPIFLPPSVTSAANAMGMDTSKPMHNLDAYIQVDGLPLEMGGQSPSSDTAQFVRFQLLMSEATFDYILDKQVYNVNGQEALTADLDFPAQAWELKTSWLWIGDNSTFKAQLESDGYYIVQAYFADDDNADDYTVGYAALSGMHVINKLVDDWVWATFENTHNSKYTITNGFPAEPMTNKTGPTENAITANSEYQASYPFLANYELIGVQWNFDEPPELLANSQMESAFQSRSSCIDCHFTAAYSPQQGYFNFATKTDGGILYPTEKTPDEAFAGFQKLDFVWSLKRAQWKR